MRRKKTKKGFWILLIFNFSFLMFNFNCVATAETALDDLLASTDAIQQTQELVSLDYKDADLSSVLRSLSYSYNLNLIATKNIKGKVTVSLRNVRIEEALNAILTVNGYTFTRKGRLIYITPGPGLEGIDTVTATIPIKYLIASEASMLLQKTISSKGDIRVNEATNSLVITDYPAFIQKLASVLEEVDVPPIQVLIEAKLVEITETDYANFGITYTMDIEPKLAENILNIEGGQTLSGPSTSLSGGQLKITAFSFRDVADVSLTIDALLQDNKAHLLASPSIATLNGQEARIIIGERYPYKEKTQTTTGTTETTKFVDIGTTLRVTPRVSPDGWITMVVHPEVSSLAAQLDDGPRITTREADVTIRIKDGETIVIGGLIKRQEDKIKSRIPLLGHIPILGWLFTKASLDTTVTELVVFITPHIIRTPAEAKTVKSSRQKEVYIDIEGIGERVAVSKLWEEASNLERNTGTVSKRKDKETRLSAALDRYKQIASQFASNEKADDALYRAGRIAYKHFGDLQLAKRLFSQLVRRYPNSPLKKKAKHWINHIDKKQLVIEKRERRKSRKRAARSKRERKEKKKGLFPLRFDQESVVKEGEMDND